MFEKHETDATADGTYETFTTTEFLADSRTHTGYTQTIRETVRDSSGVITKTVDYSFGHDEVSQNVVEYDSQGQATSATVHFFGHDGHGSVRVLINEQAGTAEIYHYDAYGNAIGFQPAVALTSIQYSGEAFNAKINLQYLRARWYDATTGRFPTDDPFFGRLHDPQSLHRYVYTHADPVNGIDPTGMSLMSVTMTGAIIGGLTGLIGGAAYGAARASQQRLEGAAFWSTVGQYAITGALVGGALGGALGYGTTVLAYHLWTSGAAASATAAYAQAGVYLGFPVASAGFALGVVQYKNGIDNDDPVDTIFGALAIATSLFGMFGTFRSIGAGSGSGGGLTVRRFTSVEELNAAANNPQPSTRYEFGAYRWTTNAQGRVQLAEGRVVLGKGGRDTALQGQIGNQGHDTDVGFHLIADSFTAPTNRVNVVPGNGRPTGDGVPNLNQGAYRIFENAIRQHAKAGDAVDIRVEALYNTSNTTARPDTFVGSFRVNDGTWVSQTFSNKY